MSKENYCLICDVKFTPNKLHPHQKYCGSQCRANASHRQRKGLPLKLVILKCIVCDKEFEQTRANNMFYCHKNCKHLAATRKLQGLPINGPRKIIRGSGHTNMQGYRLLAKKTSKFL